MTSTANQSTAEIRPTKTGIWIGIVLMVVALIAFVVLMVTGMIGVFGDLGKYPQVAPGSAATVQLDSGDYLIFVDETLYTDVTVIGPSGPIQLTSESGTTSYTSGGTTWSSAYSFDAPEAGGYEVTNTGSAVITVGPPFAGKLVRAILMPFLLGFVIGGAGLALLLTTLARRRSARRRLTGLQPSA